MTQLSSAAGMVEEYQVRYQIISDIKLQKMTSESSGGGAGGVEVE